MENYNYDRSITEDEHQETINNDYKKFRRLYAIEELKKRHTDLKYDIELVYQLAEDYEGHNYTSELETELMRMEG